MLKRLYARRAEFLEDIKDYETEIAKAKGKLELLEELIEDAEAVAAEKATEVDNGSVAIYP